MIQAEMGLPALVPGNKVTVNPEGGQIRRSVILLLLLLVPLAGCARLTPEEALRKRAQEFWELKIKKDFVRAYDYLDPTDRDQISLADWLKGFGAVEWSAAEVVETEIRGSRGIARVRYHYIILKSFARGQTGQDEVPERWVLRKGRWYKSYVPPSLGPGPGAAE